MQGRIFLEYEKFFFDLISNLMNRHLAVYENWKIVRQKPDQKISAFKAYLEELKNHIPILNPTHQTNFFLIKLKSDLKDKILSIDNVSNNKEKILVKVLMQKQILKRSRRNTDGFQIHFKSKKGSNKGKFLESRVSTPHLENKNVQSTIFSRFENIKRKDYHFNPDYKDNTCFHCRKKKYRNSNCSDKNKSTMPAVTAITSKNEETPSRSLKRNKNNLDK